MEDLVKPVALEICSEECPGQAEIAAINDDAVVRAQTRQSIVQNIGERLARASAEATDLDEQFDLEIKGMGLDVTVEDANGRQTSENQLFEEANRIRCGSCTTCSRLTHLFIKPQHEMS